MKILFVDDNDTFRELLQYALETFGYEVETARDGLAGLEKLEEASYDLLITDNKMPRMGGLNLIEKIYQREIDIKTVLISGDLIKDIIKCAKERGVCECLPKPFSLDVLRETVLRVFEEAKISNRERNFILTHVLHARAVEGAVVPERGLGAEDQPVFR